jgi:hypothetical protein
MADAFSSTDWTNAGYRLYSPFHSPHPGPMELFAFLYREPMFRYRFAFDKYSDEKFQLIEKELGINEAMKIYLCDEAQDNEFDNASSHHRVICYELKPRLLLYIQHSSVEITYGRDIPYQEIVQIAKVFRTHLHSEDHRKKFSMIIRSDFAEFGFELKEFPIRDQDIQLKNNYEDDFLPVNTTIEEFLRNENANGLVLLHGKYGTGKTSYIRHLMSMVDIRFIFLPVNMVDAISNPQFLPFLSNYTNSVIVLEDCESLLAPRTALDRGEPALASLLNLADGLLSDALRIKLVCTFNAPLREVDQAILRKGRLIARYEFSELSIDKCKNLSEKMGYTGVIEKPMTLAEIYNLSSPDYGQMGSSRKLGF